MNTEYQTLVASNTRQFLAFRRALRQLHLPHKIITLHTSDGKRKAFRLSSADCVFLATINLVQFN
jgi:hypothetical protein